MRDYRSGRWGFKLIWGLRASVFPRALALALPNAVVAFVLGWFIEPSEQDKELSDNAFSIWAAFSTVLFFLLSFRSSVAYNRWWEGGTLLQQTRGEWFNAYSSLIAFTSPDPSREAEVEAYQHMLARLMSLLFCSALQQVSPNRNRAFEIIDSTGIDPKSLHFLSESNDRVEVILQWVQRSTILNMMSGVLPIPPPVMSRAFQEISRGIVNLQNARKIAEFPFPFPYAQTSIVMLVIHWAMCPILSSMLLNSYLAAATCFVVVFFIWCINFIALELESPFGVEDNDLPMDQMQVEWNKSVATLLARRANQPPRFDFDPPVHRRLEISMSDGSSTAKRISQYVRFNSASKMGDDLEPDGSCYTSERDSGPSDGKPADGKPENHQGRDGARTSVAARPRESLGDPGGPVIGVLPSDGSADSSQCSRQPSSLSQRRLSASQVTAAALARDRPDSGPATVTATTGASNSNWAAGSSEGASSTEAPRHDAGGGRLAMHCPGMECLSPFPRPKKPRGQHRKPARGKPEGASGGDLLNE